MRSRFVKTPHHSHVNCKNLPLMSTHYSGLMKAKLLETLDVPRGIHQSRAENKTERGERLRVEHRSPMCRKTQSMAEVVWYIRPGVRSDSEAVTAREQSFSRVWNHAALILHLAPADKCLKSLKRCIYCANMNDSSTARCTTSDSGENRRAGLSTFGRSLLAVDSEIWKADSAYIDLSTAHILVSSIGIKHGFLSSEAHIFIGLHTCFEGDSKASIAVYHPLITRE